jgi:uncharacterized protein (DUF2344 family)
MRCKGYVRTKSHQEGSICEGHKFDESLTFCSQYLNGCETRFTRKARNGDVALLENRLDQVMQMLEKLQQQVPSQNHNITPHGSNNELLVVIVHLFLC